jgi:hypothetical protein
MPAARLPEVCSKACLLWLFGQGLVPMNDEKERLREQRDEARREVQYVQGFLVALAKGEKDGSHVVGEAVRLLFLLEGWGMEDDGA